MRIAIVVDRGAALSVPFGWGQPGRGRETYAFACFTCGSARGAARGASGAIWASAPGSFFSGPVVHLVCRNTSLHTAHRSEFAGVDTRREPLVARKDAQCC